MTIHQKQHYHLSAENFIIFKVVPIHVQYIMKGCDLHLSKNIVIHIDNELGTIFAELLCPPIKELSFNMVKFQV